MKRLFIISAITLFATPLFAAKVLRCAAVALETDQKSKVTPSFSATAVIDVIALVQFKHDQTKDLAEGDHFLEVRWLPV